VLSQKRESISNAKINAANDIFDATATRRFETLGGTILANPRNSFEFLLSMISGLSFLGKEGDSVSLLLAIFALPGTTETSQRFDDQRVTRCSIKTAEYFSLTNLVQVLETIRNFTHDQRQFVTVT